MAEQQQSIIDILPEDILIILLSRHGLHPSLGSTCKHMRQLSLSEKCIGSVCICLNNKNIEYANPNYLPYRYAYKIVWTCKIGFVDINDLLNRYKLSGNLVWPYLKEFDVVINFTQQFLNRFPEIYAPRLTKLDIAKESPEINHCVMLKHLEEIQKRMPMLETKINKIVVQDSHGLEIVLKKYKTSGRRLFIESCYFYVNPWNYKDYLWVTLPKQTQDTFIRTTILPTHPSTFDIKVIEYMTYITQDTIRLDMWYSDGAYYPTTQNNTCVSNDLINEIQSLYDLCYSHNTTTTTNVVTIELKIHNRMTIEQSYLHDVKQVIYNYVIEKYPKIKLSETDELILRFEYTRHH